jgi:hypothetical protein
MTRDKVVDSLTCDGDSDAVDSRPFPLPGGATASLSGIVTVSRQRMRSRCEVSDAVSGVSADFSAAECDSGSRQRPQVPCFVLATW